MKKISKDNNEFKMDKKINSEMEVIESIRPSNNRKKPPNPSNVIPAHAYKPQIDPRLKNDKTFQEFYSKIEKITQKS